MPNVTAPFQLAKYQLDRAHEIELNKFSHSLEVERLKVLQLLNGGAFTVLIAFLDKDILSGGDDASIALGVAVSAWLFGLGTVAFATQRALDAQSRFAAAYHARRRATEWRFLRADYPTLAALEQMVAPLPTPETQDAGDFALNFPRPPTPADGDARFDWRVGIEIANGRARAGQVKFLYAAGVSLFIVGGVAAARLVGLSVS